MHRQHRGQPARRTAAHPVPALRRARRTAQPDGGADQVQHLPVAQQRAHLGQRVRDAAEAREGAGPQGAEFVVPPVEGVQQSRDRVQRLTGGLRVPGHARERGELGQEERGAGVTGRQVRRHRREPPVALPEQFQPDPVGAAPVPVGEGDQLVAHRPCGGQQLLGLRRPLRAPLPAARPRPVRGLGRGADHGGPDDPLLVLPVHGVHRAHLRLDPREPGGAVETGGGETVRPVPLHSSVPPGRVANTGTSPLHSSAISSSSTPGRAGAPRRGVRSSDSTWCRSAASRIRSGWVDSSSSVVYVQVGRGTTRTSSRANRLSSPSAPRSSSRCSPIAVYPALKPPHSASVYADGSAATPPRRGRLADSAKRPARRTSRIRSVPASAQSAVATGDEAARPPPMADMSSAVVSPTSNCGSRPTRWTESCRARAAGSEERAGPSGGWNRVSTSTRTGCGPQAIRFSWCRSVPSSACSRASRAPWRQ